MCANKTEYESETAAMTVPPETKDSESSNSPPPLPNLGVGANTLGHLTDILVRPLRLCQPVPWHMSNACLGPNAATGMHRVDDGLVWRERAHGGRDDGADAVCRVEDRGDSAQPRFDSQLRDCHSGVTV